MHAEVILYAILLQAGWHCHKGKASPVGHFLVNCIYSLIEILHDFLNKCFGREEMADSMQTSIASSL